MRSRRRRWLLCGGIGSGKSEVRALLAEHGIRTVDADAVGRQVLSEEAFAPVAERWPEVVLEGEIRRETLARIVFEDSNELVALEAITHPLIFGRIRDQLEGFPGIVVVEVPVIASGLGWPMMVVDSADEARLRRAVARGMTRRDVARRMRSQPSRAEWLAVADLVIPNHGTLEDLRATVRELTGYLDNRAAPTGQV